MERSDDDRPRPSGGLSGVGSDGATEASDAADPALVAAGVVLVGTLGTLLLSGVTGGPGLLTLSVVTTGPLAGLVGSGLVVALPGNEPTAAVARRAAIGAGGAVFAVGSVVVLLRASGGLVPGSAALEFLAVAVLATAAAAAGVVGVVAVARPG